MAKNAATNASTQIGVCNGNTEGYATAPSIAAIIEPHLGGGGAGVPSNAATAGIDFFGNAYAVGDPIVTYPGGVVAQSGSGVGDGTGVPSNAAAAGVDFFGTAYAAGDPIITYPAGVVKVDQGAVGGGAGTPAVAGTSVYGFTARGSGVPGSIGEMFPYTATEDGYAYLTANHAGTTISSSGSGSQSWGFLGEAYVQISAGDVIDVTHSSAESAITINGVAQARGVNNNPTSTTAGFGQNQMETGPNAEFLQGWNPTFDTTLSAVMSSTGATVGGQQGRYTFQLYKAL